MSSLIAVSYTHLAGYQIKGTLLFQSINPEILKTSASPIFLRRQPGEDRNPQTACNCLLDGFCIVHPGNDIEILKNRNALYLSFLRLLFRSRSILPENKGFPGKFLKVYGAPLFPFGIGPVSYTHLDVYKRQ